MENSVTIPKEQLLISLVAQEQALYNPKHQNYRSTKCKDEKWNEIGSHVGWTGIQCKAKWKALRDQYCRELKRAKTCVKAVKWKYYKELDFLRPYALARNYRGRTTQIVAGQQQIVSTNQSFNSNSSSSGGGAGHNLNLAGSIKIEDATPTNHHLLGNCGFVPSSQGQGGTVSNNNNSNNSGDKNVSSTTTTSSFIIQQQPTQQQHHHHHQQQQQQDNNWNYLTTDGGTNAVQTSNVIHATTVDRLYNDFVDCVNASAAAAVANAPSSSTPSAGTSGTVNADLEEDDDPLHTFLNMEIYFEKELITLIQQEDMIYNYGNENYRNAKLKMEVWEEIARKLRKSVKQCRQKWKALRDQYAREHKRLRTLMPHLDSISSRWKHYDSLNFLQKYIQQKTLDNNNATANDGSHLNMLLPKHVPVTELDAPNTPPPATASAQSAQVQQESPVQTGLALPPLSGPHKGEMEEDQQQHQHQSATDLCVASYDEMDIENYINGDVPHTNEDDDDDDVDDDEEDVEEEEEEEEEELDEDEEDQEMVVTGDSPIQESPQQQQQQHQEHQQQQHQQQQQPQLEVSYNTNENPIYMTLSKQEGQQPPTTSVVEIPTNAHPTSNHGNLNPRYSLPAPTLNDDDEIGAFFKAVAMKIRNAQLEPVAFTDLQIDILQVINKALRNH
ncbi:putative uncharacterized protein DDB_G0271606 [Drosophila tropicalis]|uniref:putative uncharacterized protein DDB_G0271606 n=1 Tax=Drosophila tropicalis TaxID=46794 RepID=UPI0035AC236A